MLFPVGIKKCCKDVQMGHQGKPDIYQGVRVAKLSLQKTIPLPEHLDGMNDLHMLQIQNPNDNSGSSSFNSFWFYIRNRGYSTHYNGDTASEKCRGFFCQST